MFIIKYVDSMNQGFRGIFPQGVDPSDPYPMIDRNPCEQKSWSWSEMYKDFFFNFVIRSVGPAYNSFLNVLSGHHKQDSLIHIEPGNSRIREHEHDTSPLSLSRMMSQSPGPRIMSPLHQNPMTQSMISKGMVHPDPMDLPSPLSLPRMMSPMHYDPFLPASLPTCSFQFSPRSTGSNDHESNRGTMYRSEDQRDSVKIGYEDFTRNMQKLLVRDFSKQFVEISQNNGSCFRFENGIFMKSFPFKFKSLSDKTTQTQINDYQFTLDQFTLNKQLMIRGKPVTELCGMIVSFETTSGQGLTFFRTNRIHGCKKN